MGHKKKKNNISIVWILPRILRSKTAYDCRIFWNITKQKRLYAFPWTIVSVYSQSKKKTQCLLMGVTPLEKNHWSVKFNFEHDRNNPGKISSRNLLQNKPIRERRVIFVAKLYIPSIINIWKKLLCTAIWAYENGLVSGRIACISSKNRRSETI